MNKNFFTFDNLEGDFPAIRDELARGTPTAVFGATDPLKRLIAAAAEQRAVYVCADAEGARRAAEGIRALSGKSVALLTAKDEVLLRKAALSKDSLYRRLEAIHAFRSGADVLVGEIDAFLQLFPRDLPSVTLRAGEEHSLEGLKAWLVSAGYAREQSAGSKGTFAVHGDILDIFPVGGGCPARVDFFGDEVEAIRPYDAVTGEPKGNAESLLIVAATDVFPTDEERGSVARRLKKEARSARTAEACARAESIAESVAEELEGGGAPGFVMPLLSGSCDFFSWLGEERDTLIILDETKRLSERAAALTKEHRERCRDLAAAGEAFPFTERQCISDGEFAEGLSSFRRLALQTFTGRVHFFDPLKTFSLKSVPISRYLNRFDELFTDIGNWLRNGYRVIFFCGSAGRAEKMRDALWEHGTAGNPPAASLKEQRGLALSDEELERGFVLHCCKTAVIGTGDVFTKAAPKRLRRRRGDVFSAPEIGDYAVHETHGIGRVTGMKKIESLDGIKEYVALEYRDGDMLYVPAERMDTLSRYVGDPAPQLSKIGGAEFARVKERVRRSLKKMAIDLKKLYAERSSRKGYAFPYHRELMDEFCAAFEHTETPDQLESAREIVSDMCSTKVMDRVLCGDVGFGKTEVAFRAVYLCVLGGKQAALMCPTTILCEQHYRTAVRRFADFGVRVERINRFRTAKEQRQTLEDLAAGKVDFLIGTHRLLSGDVRFRDLGLLVLDEEQRFGVEHKERIKSMKSDIDCLTLTATPIPRTLHMALTGIRDISTIDTPPENRLPVQTYVVEETEALLRDACVRELSRGGQVFILYNRVQSIAAFAARIAEIVPEGKVCAAHGQMDRDVLEDTVMRFYEGEFGILVTTTIIENGIDLPNANTLIVIDADRLGVSQLYQLRGRVGRGSRLAHAYFTYRPEKVMTEEAAARLSAVMEFTELGSGMKIAVRDLEIRGAGNILGAEQHGHMDKVGYELYSKLLREELTGTEAGSVDLDIQATAYIPEGYIEDSAARLDCYKRIAEIRSAADCRAVMGSIESAYGKMPEEMSSLLLVALLKCYAAGLGITKIAVSAKGGSLGLPSLQTLSGEGMRAAMDRFRGSVVLSTAEGRPTLEFRPRKSQAKTLAEMAKFLKYARTFTAVS